MRGRAAGSSAVAENQGKKGAEPIVAIGTTCITLYYTTGGIALSLRTIRSSMVSRRLRISR